ncbi:MAG: NAD-dependent epimerase/dehydratase family protein [Sulfobacillus sp.]
MRIFVTGAGGFIGSRVVKDLLANGHQVNALLRPGGQTTRLDRLGGELAVSMLDLRDTVGLTDLLAAIEPDAVVHLAWYTEPTSYLVDRQQNLESLASSVNLLKVSTEVGASRIVLGGTCLEMTEVRPASTYALAKKALHDLALGPIFNDMSIVCAHIYSPYGPGEHPARLIPSLMQNLLAREPIALGPGTQKRDYIHVADVASAICLLAESNTEGSVDVCMGESRSVKDIAGLISEMLDGSELIKWGERLSEPEKEFDTLGDPGALRNLGWRPKYSLIEGLNESRIWWEKHLHASSPA